MDTTEERNNTYYYHGHGNLTAGELFNLIVRPEDRIEWTYF